LLAHNVRTDVLDVRDVSRRFRNHAGDGVQSINAESTESFQISLRASAGTAVGTGDR